MFKKVLLKLTALNSAVLLLILVVYGGAIYLYVSDKVFDNVDHSMRETVHNAAVYEKRMKIKYLLRQFQHTFFDHELADGQQPPLVDLKMTILLEDAAGRLIRPGEGVAPAADHVRRLTAGLRDGVCLTRSQDGHHYRMLSASYPEGDYPTLKVGRGKTVTVRRMIVMTQVDAEMRMIRTLALMILCSTVAGMVFAVLAGYYLARYAIVPIRRSWDKQQRFMADASHELRVPVAVIRTNAELLFHHPGHSIEQEIERIAAIQKESMRMGRLITTLLTLARADSNQVEMAMEVLVLTDIIREAVDHFSPLCKMRRQRLTVDAEPGIKVNGDRERLYQLAAILLDNAVKYTPHHGSIRVECRENRGQVLLAVADDGIGIAPADLKHLFERFFRADQIRSREEGGVGLGLAIAKWIVDKHQGKIQVKSALRQGTRVEVTLRGLRGE